MKWAAVIGYYLFWNICAYANKGLFGRWFAVDRGIYDKVYWLNERIFVLIVFSFLPVPKEFKLVKLCLIFVASWKLFYIILVVTNTIKPNDLESIMGMLFMIALGFIVWIWEKQSNTS
jgi:hypothetical protein